MASTGKSISEQDYLANLDRKVGGLYAEAKRLNRRLRNARGAIQSIEDELAILAEQIESRLAQLRG